MGAPQGGSKALGSGEVLEFNQYQNSLTYNTLKDSELMGFTHHQFGFTVAPASVEVAHHLDSSGDPIYRAITPDSGTFADYPIFFEPGIRSIKVTAAGPTQFQYQGWVE